VTNVTRFAVAALVACSIPRVSGAQVLAPTEIKDPKLRALQSKHLSGLTAAAVEIASHGYPSKFYLTRALDLSGRALESADQRSIEFAVFEKQTVLLVRGNYSAAYPRSMPRKDRVSRTYLDVAVPILNATIPRVKDEPEMDAIVIELSHHVREMALVTVDRFENLAFVLPRITARNITESSDPGEQLAALNDAKVYIDGRVVPFGGQEKTPAAVVGSQNRPGPGKTAPVAGARPAVPSPDLPAAPVATLDREDLSPAALERRQVEFQPVLDRMVQELGPQAHFDPSAKPALTAFRSASYLSLRMMTTLAAADAGSQYRLAALAFDRHISHLVRSVLPYFKGAPGFEGIAFRTTVSAGSNSDSVEFLFPITELRRYENYDITGQQLINAGFVLINGERVGLDLQIAETVKP
jgi:hypothetical protein